ncbi:MAG: hypothetical protein DI535_07625 [Citrobacter freundii]|nr:MAG: hypothetical protein DI535_07625 [Citrobacter freundii]
MYSVQNIIKDSLSGFSRQILVPADFKGSGTEAAIKMSLSRLAKAGTIRRLAHGIYYVPVSDPVLGELIPSPESVAEELAEKERVRIRPAGAFALNKLGLSTQVPTRLVYLTDGNPRKLKVGKASIEFKSTTPKKMSLRGKISSLLILALEELDLQHLDKKQQERIYHLVEIEDPEDLTHDLKLAPNRIHDYLITFKRRIDEQRMANPE